MKNMYTGGQQHIHARKRVYRKLSPYPHPYGARRAFDYLMYIVGSLAPLALIPQVIAIYGQRDASGLAFETWFILSIINALWTTYGILHKERPIIVANIGMLLLNLSVVFGIILYG